MRRIAGVVIASLLFSVFSASAPRTLRVDYYHTGNAHEEWFSLDRVVLEPLEWPGNPRKAIDESQLGDYLFEVREQSSGKLLYSKGFNSVFGEWKTTQEARHGKPDIIGHGNLMDGRDCTKRRSRFHCLGFVFQVL